MRTTAAEPPMGSMVPLRRQTLTGMTPDALRERILRVAFSEGEPLRQDAIAEELDVSRIPVRKARTVSRAPGQNTVRSWPP